MDTLPLHFKLKDLPCLVVGGGEVALRKCQLLAEAEAKLTVVAKEISLKLQSFLAHHDGLAVQRGYRTDDLAGMRLVVAATNDEAVNGQVFHDAEAQSIPVNVVDAPHLCRFLFPAIVDRSPVVFSVGTQGTHPVLARSIRTKLESSFPASFGELARLLAKYRQSSKDRFKNANERRIFWESVLESPVYESALCGNLIVAEQQLKALLEAYFSGQPPSSIGEIYLVGAGPGEPDLMTFRALRLLQKSDVVIHDRLVSKEIIAMARRDAQIIYAGKQRDQHTIAQEQINELLVERALKGERVCRLKGGDPFIFGRGGEEIATLMAKNIPFQVVPGITAASGCASYAGIPLTHRDFAQSVRFITGHLKEGKLELPWKSLVVPNETLVFYMGLISLPIICRQLTAHGLPKTLPAALVQCGTMKTQQVYCGTLETLPGLIEREKPVAPCLLIVGEVVRLRRDLDWFTPQQRQKILKD